MKISTIILSASVVLNVVLLGTICAGLTGDASSAPTAATAAAAAAAAATARAQPTGPGPETWTALARGSDLAKERDQLRAEGFPDRLVRAIIAAQIREKYAGQRQALERDADTPFWKATTPDPKTVAALRQLSQAQRKELRDLLGADQDNYAAMDYQRQIPNLSADKAEQLAEIAQRYNDQRSEMFSGGALTPMDQQKLAGLDKAMHAEFASVLTPQELEEYDLRASRTAMQLQYELSAFQPTEAEYRALYKLRSAFDEQYSPMYGGMTQDEMKARMDAQKQLQSDISSALGADRYAQYQKATDYTYRQTTELVSRLSLPPETADSLYALQKEYQQKQQDTFKELRGSGTTMSGVREQLVALQTEATGRVSALLNGNAEAIDAYKTYGGFWLRNMVPTVRSSAPTTPGTSSTTIITRGPGP